MAALAVNSILSVGQGVANAQSARAQGEYQNAVAQMNAKIAERAANDSIERGNIEANEYQRQVNMILGNQKAAFASQGLDTTYGSARDIRDETRVQGQEDVITIKGNAFREAMGYKTQALNQRAQGDIAKIGAKASARQSLITAGTSVLSNVAQYGEKKGMFAPSGKG